MVSRKKIGRNIFFGIFSIIIIYLFLSRIDIIELSSTIRAIDGNTFFIGLFVYLFNYYIRILRLQFILGKYDLFRWVQFTTVFQLLNRTLPFRLGEAFFPILLKRLFVIEVSEAVSKLIIIRFLDLLSLFLFFIASLTIVFVQQSILLLLIGGFLFSGIAVLYRYKKNIFDVTFKLVILIIPSKKKFFESFFTKVLSSLNINQFQLTILFLYSLLDKVINYGLIVLIISGLGFSIPLEKLLVAIGLSGFSEILPINSLGSFGTLELGWVGALVMLGVQESISIQSGFSAHIVIFSYTVVLGLIFLPFILIRKKNNAESIHK